MAELERATHDDRGVPYDRVLMDWKMPGMDGFETSRRIRESKRLDQLPTIIMVTAYGREEIIQSATQSGLDGFLVKPVNPSMLFNTITETLGQRDDNQPATLAPTEAVPDLGDKRVLLLEDNAINLQVAQEILESTGCAVQIPENGAKAVQAVKDGDFHLVLMAIQMPDMDGYRATELVRQDPRFVDLPTTKNGTTATTRGASRAMLSPSLAG